MSNLTSKRELIFIILLMEVVSIASLILEPFDHLHAFLHRHEDIQLDELFTVFVGFCVLSLGLFVRRGRELAREIRRREASEVEVQKLARHDPLTGLPNRRVFGEELKRALEQARTESRECAVLMLDLDRFKPINDIHGHSAGDEVLVEVANRIGSVVGDKGIVARLGGDEFAGIIQYPAGTDLPLRLARQIIQSVGQPMLVQGVSLTVGSTLGLARAPQDGMTPSELLHAADLAMYDCKRSGRGNYRFFHSEMDADLRSRAALERDLREAVRAGEIIPHFQPIVDLTENKIIGFEALARWPHPTRGILLPHTFIPIAEDLGIIDQITYAMLRSSCAAARDWDPHLWVSVNISPMQLKDRWLASRILSILTSSGVAAGRLIVEVTENAIIDDMAKAQQIFASLQNAGVRVALDDFGRGYSSLNHLRQLRFDHLKIDGSFVHTMDTAGSAEIVSAVTGLGKSLGMAVTAEGVETIVEADALREIGCKHAQGFLFGKPVSAADTLVLLKKGRGEVSMAA